MPSKFLSHRHLALPPIKQALRFITNTGVTGRWERLRNIPINEAASLTIGSNKFHCWFDTTEGIAHQLYWYGFKGWEQESTATFARLAMKARGILDIGANTGMYSLIACAVNPNVRVISFEPTPKTLARLRQNVTLNALERRCFVSGVALSDHAGVAHFEVTDDPTMAHLAERSGSSIEVAVDTADNLVPEGMPVDLIKLDVEGSEDKVILGMLKVIERCRPAILLEVLPGGPGAVIESILRPFGYRFEAVTKNGLVEVASLADSQSSENNFLARVLK